MKEYNKTYGKLEAYYLEDFYTILSDEQKKEIDYRTFRRIIAKYFEVYVRDLYEGFLKATYFPFSGVVRLARGKYKGKNIIKWLWSMQPGRKTANYVKIFKVARGGRIVNLQENITKEKKDILELPLEEKEWRKLAKRREIYIFR